ncbi:hypothetical protein FACS1894139_05500 [Planctomycetales bacterium]|nr:hypothetical protein FACS1894107_11530 [Planctomycetales bacterium]GHT04027.1 hypothetical protein FACS1894139_05500 [Planctomycetales bacterium]
MTVADKLRQLRTNKGKNELSRRSGIATAPISQVVEYMKNLCLSVLFFLAPLTFAGEPASAAPFAVSADDLVKYLREHRFTPAETEKLRQSLNNLPQSAPRPALGDDSNRLADELLAKLQQQYQTTGGRPLALIYARYLMFLNDAPGALAVLTRIRPASDADAAWLLAMADVHLQIGDAEKAGMYATRATDLLNADQKIFALSSPVAVSRVEGYRLYTPDPRPVYAAGSALILYVEVMNAKFQKTGAVSRCALAFGLELLDANGAVADKNPDYGLYDPDYAGAVRELQATIHYPLPPTVAAGKYTLRIYCTDNLAGQKAQTDFSFTVASASPQSEITVDAEGLQKAIDAGVWSADEDADNKTTRKLENMLKGLDIRREQSKMQGGLIGQ